MLVGGMGQGAPRKSYRCGPADRLLWWHIIVACQPYPRTNKTRDAGQWRCCPLCLSGSAAEPPALVTEAPVAAGREGAGHPAVVGGGSGDVGEGERAQGAVCSEPRSLGRVGAEVSVEHSRTWRPEGGRPWRSSLTGSRR